MVIHTSDDPESIYKYIPKDVLPEEYGGEGEKLQELTGMLFHDYLTLDFLIAFI